MARRRFLSKRFRIALYMALCLCVWFGCTFFLLASLIRAFDRRYDELKLDFDRRLREFSFSSVGALDVEKAGSGGVSTSTSTSTSMSDEEVPRFIVLGHGRSKRFGYLDIQYVSDGCVDRFFYGPDTLRDIPNDIEREVFRHEHGLVGPRLADRDNALTF